MHAEFLVGKPLEKPRARWEVDRTGSESCFVISSVKPLHSATVV
jgi:hypothetical protein